MNAYFDTSVLTGVYCAEPASERWQERLQQCEPVISRLTCLEFSSAVAKKLRMKTFTKTEATKVIAQFHSHLKQNLFEIMPVQDVHFALANDWIGSFITGLRTLDALHLAMAHANQLLLVTADGMLAKAAKKLGLAVERI